MNPTFFCPPRSGTPQALGLYSFLISSLVFVPRLGSAQAGSLDLTFDPGSSANSEIMSVGVQSSGKLIIGGAFSSYNGTNQSRIARLNPDGALDLTFNSGSGANLT